LNQKLAAYILELEAFLDSQRSIRCKILKALQSLKEFPLPGAGNSQFASTSKPFSASYNTVLSPSLSVPHFSYSKEIDYGSGAPTGGEVPGIGNVLHLDLSLPVSQSHLLQIRFQPRKEFMCQK
jgi:hypothetical protein